MPTSVKNMKGVFFEQSLYLGGGFTLSSKADTMVYSYNPKLDMWKLFPPSPLKWFSMAVINNQIVLVGGKETGTVSLDYTNKLASWNKANMTWIFLLPPMRNRRCSPVVVSHNRNLIVAGGNKGLLDYSVEVLDSESKQWMLASQLPLSCSSSPNTVYKECWYFFREADNSVIYTNLSNIVDSAIDQSENQVIESGLESGYNSLSCSQDSQPANSQSPKNLLLDWHIYCTLPFTPTRISTIQGCLVAFSNHEDSSSRLAVYGYTSESKNWTHLGNLPALCSNASFIASPSELFVVGGDTSSSTSASQYSNKMFCASIREPS